MINNDLHLKSLYVKAKRRGMIELDLVIGEFAHNNLQTLSYAEVKLFEELLDLDDEYLYRCLLHNEVMHTKFKDLWYKIKKEYRGKNA